MLKFIGIGSAFNTKLGNNSAYYREGDNLYLIDCGSLTFARILDKNLLDEIKNIYILITHTHTDHIASLGDLTFYSYFVLKKKVFIIYPYDTKVIKYLKSVGINKSYYEKYEVGANNCYVFPGLEIIPVKTKHVQELNCYGYILNTKDKKMYYSGDSNIIPDQVLNYIELFDIIYQDTGKADYPGNVHLSLRKLTELIPEQYRSKIYCMHLDNGFDIKKAKALGFNVVGEV